MKIEHWDMTKWSLNRLIHTCGTTWADFTVATTIQPSHLIGNRPQPHVSIEDIACEPIRWLERM